MDYIIEMGFSETKAVHQCVYCSSFSNEKGKLLDCLHFICQNCLSNYSDTFGVRCKCKVITKNFNILEFSILPDGANYVMCSKRTCYELAKKTCNHCKSLFCESCSQVHSSTTKDHVPLIKKIECKLCAQCNEKDVETFCLDCSIMLCSNCQIKEHESHLFRDLPFIGKQTTSSGQHDHLYQSALELKKILEISYLNVEKKRDKNKKAILELMQKNIYYDHMIRTVFDRDEFQDFFNLSTLYMYNVRSAQSKILEMSMDMETFKITLKVSSDGTLINGLLAVKAVGKITSSMTLQPGNSFSLDSEELSTSLMFTIHVSSGLMKCDNEVEVIRNDLQQKTCVCCDKLINSDNPSFTYFSCSTCSRTYHKQCHIPQLSEYMMLFFKNECTLCRDISTYMRSLNTKDLEYRNKPIGESERKILERILMEIYCKNPEGSLFHSSPSNNLYPDYAQQFADPISLNDIKRSLQSDKSYTLNLGITNLNQVFSNAMKYFPESHQYHNAARSLQNYLNTLIDKFIPSLSSYYVTY